MSIANSDRPIGIRGVAGVLPPKTLSIEELRNADRLISDAASLEGLGFEKVHVCDPAHGVEWMAREAAERAMCSAGIEPGEVDMLIWVSALAETHIREPEAAPYSPIEELLGRFHYRASWLQDVLSLDAARVTSIAQQGCAGMFSALSMAHAILASDASVRNVLCVSVDALPEEAPREILYNLISDAACAVVLSRENLRCRWKACHQVSKGYYWNIVEKQKEIIASYFPTSRAVIRELLAKAGLEPDGIRWILPTGVSQGSWEILAGITSLDPTRIYRGPARFGHTIAADNLLQLEALLASGEAQTGDPMLLFTYGFGSSWCGLILEAE